MCYMSLRAFLELLYGRGALRTLYDALGGVLYMLYGFKCVFVHAVWSWGGVFTGDMWSGGVHVHVYDRGGLIARAMWFKGATYM